MDRHLFLAAPLAEGHEDSATLSVYYDITSGHYECDVDNRIAGVIRRTDAGEWVDAETGEQTDLSRRAGELIDKRKDG
jgi:hypothetical protein